MSTARRPSAPDSAHEKKRAIGVRLAEARSKLGLTQQQLAKAIGASLQTVKSYEGGRRTPTGGYTVALARLGINVSYLFEGGKHAPLLKDGGEHDTATDLLLSASGDKAAGARLQRRVDATMDRLKAAQAAVAAAARRCEYQPPELVREALIIAVMGGMKPSALEPVLQLLRSELVRDALKRARRQ